MKPKIIVVLGPTASGKTSLAIQIAKHLSNLSRINSNKSRIFENNSRERIREAFERYKGAEIISADSRQIYKEMDIGTAKPQRDLPNPSRIDSNESRITNSISEKNSRSFDFYSGGINHHLINIKNPSQEYTVAEYKKDCLKTIKQILKKKKLPIIVGGTGLYIRAVVDNLDFPKTKPNPRLREQLEKDLKEKGLNYLYKKLIKLDPEAATIIDKNNPRRVIRALEITILTNKPFSKQRKLGPKLFNSLKIGISLSKEELQKRINNRVDKMINNGLVHEVKNLIKKYPAETPAFNTIGYKEIIDYLKAADERKLNTQINADKNISENQGSNLRESASLGEAVQLIKKNTWHYAKRQITWFKKDKEINWVKNEKETTNLVEKFLY